MTNPRGGAASRRKGHNFEREIARDLRKIFGEDVGRGIQTRTGTREVPDVDGTPWFIECKCGKQTNIKAALRQAAEATEGRPPVAICKDDRTEPVVAMRYSDWLILIQERKR